MNLLSADADEPGSTTIDVLTPRSIEGAAFAERMRYSIECAGIDDESFDDTIVEGLFEKTADERYNGVDVWRAVAVLPPGPCTIQAQAFGPDAEILCTMSEPFSVSSETATEVLLVLACSRSFQVPS